MKSKTIEDLIAYYAGDLHAVIAIKQAVEVLSNKEEETSEDRNDTLCNACGQFVAVDDLDTSGYHKPSQCDAFDLESIFVEGRLWFDKVNGNTYFSNRVWINGAIAFEMPMEYGYEEQYVYRAIQEMFARGYFKGERIFSIWEIRDQEGIHFYKSATYGKKSELFKGARG